MPPNATYWLWKTEVRSLYLFKKILREPNIDSYKGVKFYEWKPSMLECIFGDVLDANEQNRSQQVYDLHQLGRDPSETIYSCLRAHEHMFRITATVPVVCAFARALFHRHPGRYEIANFGNSWRDRDDAQPRVMIEDVLSLPTDLVEFRRADYMSSGRPCAQGPTRIGLTAFTSDGRRGLGFKSNAWQALARYARERRVTSIDICSIALSRSEEVDILNVLVSSACLETLELRHLKASLSFQVRALNATCRLPLKSLCLAGKLSPQQARDIAKALVARRHRLNRLSLRCTDLVDADIAVILRTARDHNTMCEIEVGDVMGDECTRVLADIARQNPPDGLRVCSAYGTNYHLHYWSVILPAIVHTTSLRIECTWPTLKNLPYGQWVAHVDEWRVLGLRGDPKAPVGTNVYHHHGDTTKTHNEPSDCAVVHGKSAVELDAFMGELPDTLHSLAVGQTDMSAGIPRGVLAKPLRRLALFNCGIIETASPAQGRQLRRRTVM